MTVYSFGADKTLGGSKSEINWTHWSIGIEINNQYLIPITSRSNDGDVLNPLGGADCWMVTLGTECSQRLASETESNLSNEVAIFPNPVTNTTTISFSLSQSQKVSLKIFDVSGRLVSTLADKIFEAGENELVWNADEVNAGIYFLQFQSAENLQTEKWIVTK